MIHSMLYSMILTSSFIFMNMNHPLAMGLMLLIQTILISLITGLMSKSFWFSYILFLIFLGGMLVLFIYVTSLASNEMFSLSMKYLLISFMIFMMCMMIYKFKNQLIMESFINNNYEMMEIYNMSINEFMNLNKLYNFPTNMITIMLINYLLITLIVIVKVTKLFFGPIRMMN